VNLIKDARMKNKFQVIETVRDEFLDITPLANTLTKHTNTTGREDRLSEVHQFLITPDKPQHVEVKLSHDDGEEWKQISLKKCGGRTQLKNDAKCRHFMPVQDLLQRQKLTM